MRSLRTLSRPRSARSSLVGAGRAAAKKPKPRLRRQAPPEGLLEDQGRRQGRAEEPQGVQARHEPEAADTDKDGLKDADEVKSGNDPPTATPTATGSRTAPSTPACHRLRRRDDHRPRSTTARSHRAVDARDDERTPTTSAADGDDSVDDGSFDDDSDDDVRRTTSTADVHPRGLDASDEERRPRRRDLTTLSSLRRRPQGERGAAAASAGSRSSAAPSRPRRRLA